MKLFGKILAVASLAISVLFSIYYFNLDMKLMHKIILPFLDKHYDSVKRVHRV